MPVKFDTRSVPAKSLPGRPPYATNLPDSAYASQDPDRQRRIRRQPSPDPNNRTSAYNVYDDYLDAYTGGSGDDDDGGDAVLAYTVQTRGQSREKTQQHPHAKDLPQLPPQQPQQQRRRQPEQQQPRQRQQQQQQQRQPEQQQPRQRQQQQQPRPQPRPQPVQQPQTIPVAAPRPGYAVPIAALNFSQAGSPSPPSQERRQPQRQQMPQQQMPPQIQIQIPQKQAAMPPQQTSRPPRNVQPQPQQIPQSQQGPPSARAARPPQTHPPVNTFTEAPPYSPSSSSPVPNSPHPLQPPTTPIAPAFARPRLPKEPDVKFEDSHIMRGNTDSTTIPKRGERGDDFWRRFSIVAKDQSIQKESFWLRKTKAGRSCLSKWVWLLGLLILLGIAGASYLAYRHAHNTPPNQAPTALGGSQDERPLSTTTTSSSSAPPASSSSLHVSPTNTVARRGPRGEGPAPLPTPFFPYSDPSRHRRRQYLNRARH